MNPLMQARLAKVLTVFSALLAFVCGFLTPTAGMIGLWVAVPALAGMGWRTSTAYLGATLLGAGGLLVALLFPPLLPIEQLNVLPPDALRTVPPQLALICLASLAVAGWAGWLFLEAAQMRRFAIRKSLEGLERDLFELREAKGLAEKNLAVHENRRKRYSRLQESATAMASSLELDKLAELALAQGAQLLSGVPLNVTIFLLDPAGKEMMRWALDLGGKAPYPIERPVGDDALNTWVIARGTSLVIKDLEKDFRFRGLDMETVKGRSFHLSPLLSTQGQVTGLVRAESVTREAMDQEDGRLLESLVVLASLAFENAKLYRETQDLAVTDGLTKLFLRRVLLEKLEQELHRAGEKESQTSLLLLDIDHFKSVNDTYGHPAGDAVLREVAARVKRSVRDVDVCGRYGGEEFMVLLPQTPLDGAMLVAERIREAVKSKAFELRGEERMITVSLGVAVFPVHGKDGHTLIEAADDAMYKSKEAGRDRVTAAGEGA